MKKGLLIFLTASITFIVSILLMVSVISLVSRLQNNQKMDLGEPCNSDTVAMFLPDDFIDDDYYVVYERYAKEAGETQFVIHQKTAAGIALTVIKEVYPDETFMLGGPIHLYGPQYDKAIDCWMVPLRNKDYPNSEGLSWVSVYIDVSSGAIKAIIP